MIHINMFSSADKVAGQGVGSAYLELVSLLKEKLTGEFDVTINHYGSADITHYHTIDPQFFISTFSKKRGRKIGYVHFLPETIEGSLRMPKFAKKIFYWYMIKFYKRMDHLVVVNPSFIPKIEAYGIAHDKISYIPNFVSPQEFPDRSEQDKQALREQYHFPQNKFIVFGSGQVQQRKGVDDFVQLAIKNPDVQFIWAGGFSFGPMTDGYDHFKKIVDQPPKNLLFPGIVERTKIADYLNLADLFFLPSYDELFPMSVLEAFSCGVPVLLRNLELYEAIISGKYAGADDLTGFDQQLHQLIADPEYYDQYQKLARSAAVQYSPDHLAVIWRQFYTEQANQ
ncbi:glycosyltransferase family 4 protein [Lapidilactobacillus mulanensis]|uniref:Glycosyltransferase family 4 protein n=1 Tax=Lapidilactobacillus mulanensis TaxID=2485999 RepID=A0ABW4DKZ7_9LACO|nr:glycosyltransferase family 4 protein [Lapidilactobacillus mulanensis]